MREIEEAVFITGIQELKDWTGRYSRVYFGNEFCQNLIPAKKELEEILDFVLSRNINFTFVTGLVTESTLSYLQELLAIISSRNPDAEIVINDWGLLGIVRKYNLTPVIGRLLTKQRRDPRILNLKGRLTQEALERSKSASIGTHLIRFLRSYSVERMEIDNLPQGINANEHINSEGMHLSLYFPFNYVTTSRQCVFNNGSPKCAKKCKFSPILLRHRTMPIPLYMKGNTIFLENQKMPDYLAQAGIDRIIYQSRIPM